MATNGVAMKKLADPSLTDLLQKAAQLHQNGQIKQAESAYLHLVEQHFERPTTHNLLGILYLQQKKYADAIVNFRQAIEAGNTDPDLLYNLGISLAETQQYSQAIEAYIQCLNNHTDHQAAWFNLGLAYQNNDQNDLAVEAFHKDYSYNQRLESLVEISSIYIKQFDWDSTEKYAIEVLSRKPDNETALYNLSSARLGRLSEMDIPDLGIIEQVIKLGQSLIAHSPQSDKGYTICGDALQQIGERQLALDHYQQALDRAPDSGHVHANVGVLKITQGDLAGGWPEIGWREQYGKKLYGLDRNSYERCPAKIWKGEILPDKHLLISSEQGIGDQIMQAQLLLELIAAGMQVTMTCNEKLETLLSRSFPDANIISNSKHLSEQQLAIFDYKTTQLELCQHLRPFMDSFSPQTSYLTPRADLVAHFKNKYKTPDNKLRVGISWKSASISAGRTKSTKLEQWKNILNVPGVQFINIQYGEYEDDLKTAALISGASIYTDTEFNPYNDIEKAAAQIASLDLVISVSNASVHMAGAMGIPCWTIVHYMPLWHWFLDRPDSVWYQSIRLFRQPQLAGWQPVLDEIAQALRTHSG